MSVSRPPVQDIPDFGRRLFQFVVVTDTHVNEREGYSTSPYETNARANARARYVFASIAQLDPQPAFIIHLGDMVHPVPELPTFSAAVEQFKAIAAPIKCPLYLLPGNHDIGDKPVDWMPAETVTAESIAQYRKYFGPDYYSFESNGCRFFALNAPLINSGLPAEQEQREWFERELAKAPAMRTFICIHYPPYVTDRNERGSYDNLDEPGRSWLLGLIEKYRPEAVFCGHVHNFWYDVIGSTKMYVLPALSFLRHDYTEFYRVGPAREFGRGDVGKFGYFLVDVHERGHVPYLVRTGGAELPEGETLARVERLPAVHACTNTKAPVGIDLRHPWAELVEITATGGVQEFERKLARNDYPLLAMWEMGVRKLRIPMQDLLDDRLRARMRLLRDVGHEFIVYSYGLPSEDIFSLLENTPRLVRTFEIVLARRNMAAAVRRLRQLRERSGASVYLSKLRMHEDAKFDGAKFSHFINHGFVPAEREQLRELMDGDGLRGAVDGFVFRVARRESPWEALGTLAELGKELDVGILAHVRLAGEGPADAHMDDHANACRVAETVFASLLWPDLITCIDTFMDVDRGYFPRSGFIDRRYDLRPAARVYANLHSALGDRRLEPVARLMARSGDELFILALPAESQYSLTVDRALLAGLNIGGRELRVIDLVTGTLSRTGLLPSDAGGLRVQSEVPLPRWPRLLHFGQGTGV